MKTPAITQLLAVMAKLRSPKGCPWDREQTHGSLAKHLIEEAWELHDAIQAVEAATAAETQPPTETPGVEEREQVVLDYCAATRGILNDDQGGPLHPPGVRMAEALHEVRDSIGRAQAEKKILCRGRTK